MPLEHSSFGAALDLARQERVSALTLRDNTQAEVLLESLTQWSRDPGLNDIRPDGLHAVERFVDQSRQATAQMPWSGTRTGIKPAAELAADAERFRAQANAVLSLAVDTGVFYAERLVNTVGIGALHGNTAAVSRRDMMGQGMDGENALGDIKQPFDQTVYAPAESNLKALRAARLEVINSRRTNGLSLDQIAATIAAVRDEVDQLALVRAMRSEAPYRSSDEPEITVVKAGRANGVDLRHVHPVVRDPNRDMVEDLYVTGATGL